MNLLDSIKIKNVELKNRLVIPPMAKNMADNNNLVTEEQINYYHEITKSKKIGLVILEHTYVDIKGRANIKQLSIEKDEDIEGLKKIVNVVHNNEAKIIAQLAHAGSTTSSEITNNIVVSCSKIKNIKGRYNEIPHALTKEEILEIENKFVESAIRAKKASFDGIELHSAHSYLLNQFYSPLTNKRTDEYGGKLENRIRIHLEIIDKIKKILPDILIFVRLGALDYMDGGNQLEDAIKASKLFKEHRVDVIDISGGMCGYINPSCNEAGYFKLEAKQIKEKVDIQVILTGGITSNIEANQLLNETNIDLIGVGRSILKDYEWPNKNMR